MSLKELTAEKHKNAERQEFVKVMFSGNIHPEFYATFLANQHPMYEFLEVNAMMHRLLIGMPEDIRRAPAILEDLQELWTKEEKPVILPVVDEYLKHIMKLSTTNPKLLIAHVYVRHMGDLAGGQMIAKRVPGSGKFYQFKNPDVLKEQIRSHIDDSLADEANVCFDFAIKTFEQLMTLDIPKYKDE
jgi:heme oxygenase